MKSSIFALAIGRGVLFGLGLCALASGDANLIAAGTPDKSAPDFGVILTDDGVKSFTDLDPQRSAAALATMVRSLRDSPVKTLVYEVAAGSQVMFYPTTVGSTWGWRSVAEENEPAWEKRMPINRAAARNGLDAVRTAGEAAKAMGLFFMPGYRMNDAHFAHDPMSNVLTGEYWLKNHDRLTFGKSPVSGGNDYGYLFDFSHEEVRAHCQAVIFEVIERYHDIMDGVQLDFMRHPLYFPPETAESRSSLMTELVASVRHKLDEVGKRENRYLALSVRVPPSPVTCRKAGLDLPQWIFQKLVDVIIPSPSITISHDMPIEDLVTLAKAHGVKVYPALYPRTQFQWPFSRHPTNADYSGVVERDTTEAQVRGAVLNYLAMGAGGFEMYNFNLPPEEVCKGAFKALADPHHGDRVYAITPAYWAEREGLFEYRKQIPATIAPGAAVELTIPVGESLAGADLEKEKFVALRLGLHGFRSLSGLVAIAINGGELYRGPIGQIETMVSGKESRPSRLHPPRTEAYLQVRVTDNHLLCQGQNKLTLRLEAPEAHAGTIQIVEAQIAVTEKMR